MFVNPNNRKHLHILRILKRSYFYGVKMLFKRSKGGYNIFCQEGGRRYLPYAFTEQGIYMLATVLRGELAEQQSIFIITNEEKELYMILLDRVAYQSVMVMHGEMNMELHL